MDYKEIIYNCYMILCLETGWFAWANSIQGAKMDYDVADRFARSFADDVSGTDVDNAIRFMEYWGGNPVDIGKYKYGLR